jgi:FtsZ-binding cell division protein ZapB
MPAKLPNATKSLVIQQWLQGKPRNDIAAENGVSSGAVTNIVKEWRHNLGFAVADELRELALTMKKVGITAGQCALGFRIATIMLKVGVDEDSFESFILDVYNRCKDIGLSSENISVYLQDLIEFSRDVLPLSKIENYIKEKTDDKRKLEQEIEKLTVQTEMLQQEKSDAESLRDMALQEERLTSSGLKWYSDLSAELRKYSIPVDDISKFGKIVDNIAEYGYDVDKVIKEFSDLEILRSIRDTLQQIVQTLENKNSDLEQRHSTLEVLVSMHTQALSTYQHLDDMGFGLKQLDFLRNTVKEIALENEIPVEDAVNKFLLDVERQYDKKLGYESKVRSLRDEVEKLNQEQSRLRAELLLLPLIGPKLIKLTQNGVSEQDIVNIATVFEKYVAGIDRQSFASELQTYGGLKSTIQKLTKESDTLREEVGSLQTQKRELNTDNQRILSNVIDSRHTFDYLQGRVDSFRNEILGLVSIVACMTYLMKFQFEPLQNLILDYVGVNEFVSLTRAYNGEEPVSIQEIKKELIKAIEIMQSKLDVNDTLSVTLSNARLALTDNENN